MGYRILSLDGGGAWALIEVRALIKLYDARKSGHDVLADFDLVAANSGGSLVLGGLVENLTLGQLLGYFEDEHIRRSIFSCTRSLADRVLRKVAGVGPKYSAAKKLPALQRLLPNRGDLPMTAAAAGIKRKGKTADVHLLIVGFDYDRNRATFFRSAKVGKPGGQWGVGDTAKVTLAEAIHASTNAPVNYFDGPAQFRAAPGRYWDGGVTGCNNPVLAAVTEAMALGNPPTEIAALSIGTATVALPWPQPGEMRSVYLRAPSNRGFKNDLQKLATSILDDPPDMASFVAHVMTGANRGNAPKPADSRIVRMSPLISPVPALAPHRWKAPGKMTDAEFKFIRDLDTDAIASKEIAAISAYTDLWISGETRNQPIRMDADALRPEVGPFSYGEAAAAWQALRSVT
jgi:hypothetical protein